MKVVLLAAEPVDHAIAHANGLAEHAEVVMIAPRRLYADLARWIAPGVTLKLVDWPRNRSLRNPAFLWSLIRLVRRERPDIVHLLSNTTLWLNAAVPFFGAAPLVVSVHDVDIHPGDRDTARLPGWASRLIVRQADGVVVHGDALRRRAAERFAIPAGRVHVLPHPAILRYAARARELALAPSPASSAFRVLIFGRMFAYKGLGDLLRAEALLAHDLPGLSITVAGRGDDPRALSRLMGRPEIYDIRHRFVPDDEVARIFTDADLVVLPYTEASQSGVLHVAAAFGRPVVVTDVGELRATVESSGLGLVVPPGNPERLAGAILALSRDRRRLAEFGAASLAWAEGRTSPATVGAQAAALYRRILQTGERVVRMDAPAAGRPN